MAPKLFASQQPKTVLLPCRAEECVKMELNQNVDLNKKKKQLIGKVLDSIHGILSLTSPPHYHSK